MRKIDDNEAVDQDSARLFYTHRRKIREARKSAKQIGYGYLDASALEKSSIHEAFCFYKTNLEKIVNEDAKMSVDYAVSSLVNTITVHVILKAIDMGG